jgi:hypothetical protein
MSSGIRASISVFLVVFLLLCSMPVSAAELSSHTETLGFVSGTGKIQVRGTLIDQEGTLFPGDDVRSGMKSYAKMILVNGSKVELFSDTRCLMSGTSRGIQLSLMEGNVGFSTLKSSVAILVGLYEVIPQPGTRGGVAFIAKDLAGIRVMNGSVKVHNIKTGKTVQVAAGATQIVNIQTNEINVPLAQLASMAPPSLPSAPPPQGRSGGTTNWALWGPIIAGIGVGTVIIIHEATKDEASPTLK